METLTHESCEAKAAECHRLARLAESPEHRTMLEHMDET
jgi:hypothetical protein